MEQKPQWREKLNGLFNTCQGELKRTAEIGKKMLTASKENTHLNEKYEELGKIVFKGWEAKEFCHFLI